MDVDRLLLDRTQLSASYDAWQLGLLIAGSLVGIAMLASAICVYQINAIPKRAAALEAASDEQALLRPASEWPVRLLEKNGWSKASETDGLDVFVQQKEKTVDGVAVTGVLFKKGEQTVAWANAIAFGNRYVWPYAEDSDVLEDGAVAVPILEAMSKGGIAEFVRNTEEYPVDIIGVGLESSHGGDPDDVYRELSDLRGQRLVETLSLSITVSNPNKVVRYRSLGLGRARTVAEKDTDTERRQRSALVIAIARMNNDTITSPVKTTLKNLVLRPELTSMTLSDYEYASQSAIRLSAPLSFDDSATEYWSVPEVPPVN